MDSEIAVNIKNLSKTFYLYEDQKSSLKQLAASWFNQGRTKKFHALDNINLEFNHGDFVGVIGRNGSGKSTLLKLIAGIYNPDKGSKLEVRGRVVPFLELGVGFNPDLSGRENIYLNGTILGMTRKYLEQKFDDIVEFAELRDFIDNPVKNYSSGMMVRLAFSIAIQADADIYILDEILAVGDEAFQVKTKSVINRFVEEKKTVIYVSHALESVEKFCNKAVWIDRGVLKYAGDPKTGVALYRKSMAPAPAANAKPAGQPAVAKTAA